VYYLAIEGPPDWRSSRTSNCDCTVPRSKQKHYTSVEDVPESAKKEAFMVLSFLTKYRDIGLLILRVGLAQ